MPKISLRALRRQDIIELNQRLFFGGRRQPEENFTSGRHFNPNVKTSYPGSFYWERNEPGYEVANVTAANVQRKKLLFDVVWKTWAYFCHLLVKYLVLFIYICSFNFYLLFLLKFLKVLRKSFYITFFYRLQWRSPFKLTAWREAKIRSKSKTKFF